MEKRNYNRFLGNDEITEHTSVLRKGISQEALDEAYNNYFKGNLEDFKNSFKTVSEVAQFISFAIESGIDTRHINQMLKVLS